MNILYCLESWYTLLFVPIEERFQRPWSHAVFLSDCGKRCSFFQLHHCWVSFFDTRFWLWHKLVLLCPTFGVQFNLTSFATRDGHRGHRVLRSLLSKHHGKETTQVQPYRSAVLTEGLFWGREEFHPGFVLKEVGFWGQIQFHCSAELPAEPGPICIGYFSSFMNYFVFSLRRNSIDCPSHLS